jgi:hypothetical protein
VGGALILDRCRAFDLFASVDAHLWLSGLLSIMMEKLAHAGAWCTRSPLFTTFTITYKVAMYAPPGFVHRVVAKPSAFRDGTPPQSTYFY